MNKQKLAASLCLSLCSAAFFVIPPGLFAQATTFPVSDPFPFLDLDADGSSDVVKFEDQADGSPQELVYSFIESSTGFVSSAIEFGSSGDIPALGDYDGDSLTDIAVVRDDGSALSWIIRNPDGDDVVETLGVPGDFILTGCDFDDDGETDPAVFRRAEGIYFLNGAGEVESISISLQDQERPTRVACGDLDDDQETEIIFFIGKERRRGLRPRGRVAVFTNSGAQVYSRVVRRPRDLFVIEANGDGQLDFAIYDKRRRQAFLTTFTNSGNLGFSSNRRRLRNGKRTRGAQALYDARENDWTVIFEGKGSKFFELDQTSNRVVRSSLARVRSDKLIDVHSFESTGD